MTVEPHPYRPHLPEPPVVKKSEPAPLRPLFPEDRRRLEEYGKAVERCGTGRVVFGSASGFHVPELYGECLADPKKTKG